MFRNRSVSLALVGLFLWATGCVKHTQIELAQVADHESIELTMTSGDRAKMRRATVESDSIRGQIQQARRIGSPAWGDTVAVPLSEVASIIAVESNTAGTVGLVVGIPLALLLIGVAAYEISCSNDGYLCD